jgi:hypothetical protein
LTIQPLAQTTTALTLSKSQKIEILKEAVDFKAFNDSNFQIRRVFFSSSLPPASVDQPMRATHLPLNSFTNTILSVILPCPKTQSQKYTCSFHLHLPWPDSKSLGNTVKKKKIPAFHKTSKAKLIKLKIPLTQLN